LHAVLDYTAGALIGVLAIEAGAFCGNLITAMAF
jgi:hypothetical protein